MILTKQEELALHRPFCWARATATRDAFNTSLWLILARRKTKRSTEICSGASIQNMDIICPLLLIRTHYAPVLFELNIRDKAELYFFVSSLGFGKNHEKWGLLSLTAVGAAHIDSSAGRMLRAPLTTTYLRHDSRQSQYKNHPLLRNGSVMRFPWKQIGTKH
jgi:hypothetical protein